MYRTFLVIRQYTTQMVNILRHFSGRLLSDASEITRQFTYIRAFLFDWDGVFNNGEKNENGSSPFSEVDAMGTNLLRFNHFLNYGRAPYTGIVSGEKNEAAFVLAKREHFHTVYYRVKNKAPALEHFCSSFGLEPKQVCFFFDDVPDLSIAPQAGLRIMVGRNATPLLIDYVTRNALADYITCLPGGQHAVREAVELLIGLSGRYDETIAWRVQYSKEYQTYLQQRNEVQPEFFTIDSSENINKQS
jgi:3-deoxy-D-manno-octulosonate 8-phosphate phosphatase (KDO 8-P phosphatase)